MADDQRDRIGRRLLLAVTFGYLNPNGPSGESTALSSSGETISKQTLELATETVATRDPGTEAVAIPGCSSSANCDFNTGAGGAA